MAIVPLSSDYVEVVTLVANPKRTFSSSSISGVTGSVPIFVRASPSEKEARPIPNFRISAFEEPNAEEMARQRGWAHYYGDPFAEEAGTDIETDRIALLNMMNAGVKAKATIQINSYGSIVPNMYFALTDADGHVYKYTFVAAAGDASFDSGFVSYKDQYLDAIVKQVFIPVGGGYSSNANAAATIKVYIAGSGFSGDVEYDNTGLITIHQYKAGAAGNTDIVALPPSSVWTITDFSGGSHYVPDVHDQVEKMMDRINSLTRSPRRHKKVQVNRFQPSFKFSKNTGRKNTVKNVLMPYYQRHYTGMQYAFSNYNCLNFFTSSGTPSDTALVYKAGYGSNSSKAGEFKYCPSQSFTFDFYINPKYTTDTPNDEFHAGTILHMSSCYAVSLVTGSSRGLDNTPNGYRILLQLSHSAEITPSDIRTDLGYENNAYLKRWSYPGVGTGHGDLIFMSSDNSLRRNHWHHVCIRWGGPNVNEGEGSFYIDGSLDTVFTIPSSSIMDPTEKSLVRSGSDALFVGNFWKGTNSPGSTNHDIISRFFNYGAHIQRGVTVWEDDVIGGQGGEDPYGFTFGNPLNAEVHDLKIYNSYRSLTQLVTGSQTGPVNIDQDLIFYLPPYFVRESPQRQILQTPFQESSGSTNDPFNVALSFGVGGHYINLENFTREFVEKDYPLLYNLTASTIDVQTDSRTADYWIHNPPDVTYPGARKRNLTVLPCDNGKFKPGFLLLRSGSVMTAPSHIDIADVELTLHDDLVKSEINKIGASYPTALSGSETDKFVNDFGEIDYSLVTLNNLVGLPTSISTKVEIEAPILSSSYISAIWTDTHKSVNWMGEGSVYEEETNLWVVTPGTPVDESKFAPSVWPQFGSGIKIVGEVDEHGDPKVFSKGSIFADLISSLPEDPAVGTGGRLTILERTRDTSSNEVVFFDVSNMFYGERIQPSTFVITDKAITGSDEKVSISLRDNGRGVLYRADAETPHAVWSNVGNIFYDDGLVLVKAPTIPNFGKHHFETSFSGLHRKYIYQLSIPCPKGMINSSSNPSYKKMKPTDYLSEYNEEFVYITGINLHDEDMNVVARVNLAQPVAKRNTDHYLFKVKLDY